MLNFNDIFVDDTKYGMKIPKEKYLSVGLYPVIDQGKEQIAGYTDESEGVYCDVPAIIFGDHTRIIKYIDVPFFLGADGTKLLKIKDNTAFNCKYLYYALSNAKIPNTGYNRHFKWLKELSFNIPSIEKQREIADLMDIIVNLENLRKKQLEKLELFVKSRFIEMFGDPVSNPHKFTKVPLSELADIKIGPFGSLLHKEDYIENGNPVVNPSHIVNGKIVVDTRLTISNQKYEELAAYKLEIGDVVLGRRGEMGRCAVVQKEGFLCGTGSVIIRTKGEVTSDYIQQIISFPTFKRTIEDMAVGQTMPNLNVPIVSNFLITKPPVEIQKRYYDFVEQVDKSKLAIQKSLDELEILKKSLMQQYFG